MHMLSYTTMDSPLGPILLTGTETALESVTFQAGTGARDPEPEWNRDAGLFRDAVQQLQRYFEGHLFTFDLRLAPRGTPFQQRVWAALREIPYGSTTTYGKLAQTLGKPTASRAVGAANGRNPIPIISPCHRVIGANGTLTGFAGGLHLKEGLLTLEHEHAPADGAQGRLL